MNSIKISTLNLRHWIEVLEHLPLDQSFPTQKYLMKVRDRLRTSLLILSELIKFSPPIPPEIVRKTVAF